MTETEDYDKSATPTLHHASHEDGGSDEVNIQDLAGELADEQKSTWGKVSEKPATFPPGGHHASHEKGGSDLVTGFPSVTTAAWNKTIGPSGDYATWAAMITAMPDLIAHAVTVTIKAGTTLTEICDLKNKHGLTSNAVIKIQAEKYFPTSGALPTADSGTATTLRDAALAGAALGDDYFNGCWIFVHHGTGTDNGPVLITDYVDATGDVVVASWPGTQPDNTSRYLIVGALIDGESTRTKCTDVQSNTLTNYWYGIGFKRSTGDGFDGRWCNRIETIYCGAYGNAKSGLYLQGITFAGIRQCSAVNCNTSNSSYRGGISLVSVEYGDIIYNGISDNLRRGIYIVHGGYSGIYNNFGDANGAWGAYAQYSAQAHIWGSECSGASGNHSNGVGDGSLAY